MNYLDLLLELERQPKAPAKPPKPPEPPIAAKNTLETDFFARDSQSPHNPQNLQKVSARAHRWRDDPTGPASAAATPTARDESPDVRGDGSATTGSAPAAPDVPVWAAPGLTRQQQWRAARLDGQRQARERLAACKSTSVSK